MDRKKTIFSAMEELDMDAFRKKMKTLSRKAASDVWKHWSTNVWKTRKDDEAGKIMMLMARVLLESELAKESLPMPSLARSPSSTLTAVLLEREEFDDESLSLIGAFMGDSLRFDNSRSFSGLSDIASRMTMSAVDDAGVFFLTEFEKKASELLLLNGAGRGAPYPLLFSTEDRFMRLKNSLTKESLTALLAWGVSNDLLLDFHVQALPMTDMDDVALASKDGRGAWLFCKAKEFGLLGDRQTCRGVMKSMSVDDRAYPKALSLGFVPDPDLWSEMLEDVQSSPERRDVLPVSFDYRGEPEQGSLLLV